VIAALAMAAWASTPFVLDVTASEPLLPWRAVAMNAPTLCGAGQGVAVPGDSLRLLGAAVVVYSRKSGNSTWGHASWRFLGCRGGAVVDEEYEDYKLTESNLEAVRLEHAGEPFAADATYLDGLLGSLFLFRNDQPADHGSYAEAIRNNREIYELWLDVDDDALRSLHAYTTGRYAEQLGRLRAREALPEAYHATTLNCTTGFQRQLEPLRWPYAIFPFAYLRKLLHEQRVELAVTYPSRSELLRLEARAGGLVPWLAAEGAHPEVKRRHPVFRRPGELPRSLTSALSAGIGPTATPAIVGLARVQASQDRRFGSAGLEESGYIRADSAPPPPAVEPPAETP
jgi:hypothetical protein